MAVGVAKHVEDETDTAHPRELSTPGKLREPARLEMFLGSGFDQSRHVGLTIILQPAAVTVRAEHGRVFDVCFSIVRPEQETRDEVIRHSLEVNLLDRETWPLNFAMNDRVERRPLRHRPDSCRNLDSTLKLSCPRFPGRRSFGHLKREVAVEVFRLRQSTVVGKLPLLEDSQVLCRGIVNGARLQNDERNQTSREANSRYRLHEPALLPGSAFWELIRRRFVTGLAAVANRTRP